MTEISGIDNRVNSKGQIIPIMYSSYGMYEPEITAKPMPLEDCYPRDFRFSFEDEECEHCGKKFSHPSNEYHSCCECVNCCERRIMLRDKVTREEAKKIRDAIPLNCESHETPETILWKESQALD